MNPLDNLIKLFIETNKLGITKIKIDDEVTFYFGAEPWTVREFIAGSETRKILEEFIKEYETLK